MLIECEFLRSRNWYSAVFILLNYSNPILRRAKFLRSFHARRGAHDLRRVYGGGGRCMAVAKASAASQREQPSRTGDAVKISSLSTRLIKAVAESRKLRASTEEGFQLTAYPILQHPAFYLRSYVVRILHSGM